MFPSTRYLNYENVSRFIWWHSTMYSIHSRSLLNELWMRHNDWMEIAICARPRLYCRFNGLNLYSCFGIPAELLKYLYGNVNAPWGVRHIITFPGENWKCVRAPCAIVYNLWHDWALCLGLCRAVDCSIPFRRTQSKQNYIQENKSTDNRILFEAFGALTLCSAIVWRV